jgi:single-strand DNA-binding protein
MASLNKVTLIGNLGKDPEIRRTGEGIPVANFTLATTESYKDKSGNWVDQTEWHNIVAWRGLAERAEKSFKKGMQIYIEGRLTTRNWEDKDGNKRYTTEVVAQSMFMLGRKEGAPATETHEIVENHTTEDTSFPTAPAPDDLPF